MTAARAPLRGAIFDVDGVLVDSPHQRAWRDALDALMEGPWAGIRSQTAWSPGAFTPQVYQRVISGKPRMAGARAALEYFRFPDHRRRAEEYADRKQAMVVALIDAGEFAAFPDALRFILAVKAAGLLVGAASSSRNAPSLLRSIDLDAFARHEGLDYDFLTPGQSLLALFDADVCGRRFSQGKPHPQIFLAAAQELGLDPRDCFVIEDAVSGIQAAKAGGMAALAIARADDRELLAAAHPDLVVTSLDGVDRDALGEGRLAVTPG